MKNVLTGVIVSAMMTIGLTGTAMAQEDDEATRRADAQQRLEEAAREIAEISGAMAMDQVVKIVERFRITDGGAVLGVFIGCLEDNGKRRGCPEDGDESGVKIAGISPGGPADGAGLEAGDIIVSLNGESVAEDSRRGSFDALRDQMDEVEPGDTVTVEYLRDGNRKSVDVVTDEMNPYSFAFSFGDGDWDLDLQHVIPGIDIHRWGHWVDHFSHMELVSLTPGLGEYFGTDEGLLVVRAPEGGDLELEDGDVIMSIDGRKPKSPEHAMRILRSYSAGEQLTIEIMREKRRRTVDIEVPDKSSDARVTDPVRYRKFRAPRAPAPVADPIDT